MEDEAFDEREGGASTSPPIATDVSPVDLALGFRRQQGNDVNSQPAPAKRHRVIYSLQ